MFTDKNGQVVYVYRQKWSDSICLETEMVEIQVHDITSQRKSLLIYHLTGSSLRGILNKTNTEYNGQINYHGQERVGN